MQEKESFLDHTQEIQINDGDLKDLDLKTSKELEKQLSVIKYDKYDEKTPIRTINPFRSPGKPAKDLIAYRKNRKKKNKAAKKSRKINRKK